MAILNQQDYIRVNECFHLIKNNRKILRDRKLQFL